MEPFQPSSRYVLVPLFSEVKWQEMRLNTDLHLEWRLWLTWVFTTSPLQSSSCTLKFAGHKVRKDEGKRRGKVWGLYLFYGTRCQWKVPVPSTMNAKTLAAGTVTLMKMIYAIAQIAVAESYSLARQVDSSWNVMAHGRGSEGETGEWSG